MYKSYSLYVEPRATQLIWRYLSANRLYDLLTTSEIYFTNISAFSDGREGMLTRRSSDHLLRWFMAQGSSTETARLELQQYEKHHEAFFANCWHMSNHESYLMWKAYANKGFAIRSTWERVTTAFESFSGEITGCMVRYVDFEREATDVGNVFHHVVTKDRPYQDEHEARLLLWKLAPLNQKLQLGERGALVQVNLRRLIDSIFVNPFLPEISDEIAALLTKNKIRIESSSIKYR